MKKKTLLIYSLVLILSLSCIGGYRSYAGTALISTGRMEFDNNTPEPEDDAIFDVDDLKALNTKISEAEVEINNIETSINNSKKEIVNILNQNPNINIGEEVSFPDIITYIQGSTNVPADTYFYEKGTEGSAAIVRYKKVGGKYYKCDANGKVAQGAQEVNVSGKQLEDYAATKAGNLSAGAAGYANGGFYLGDGSDNAAYFDRGKQDGLTQGRNEGIQQGLNQAKVGTAAPGQVLAGKTFTNSSTVGASGTMPNNGAWTNTPTAKGKVTIPAGYHNGSGYVDTTSVYNQGISDADARVNENSESYKQAAENAILNLYKSSSSRNDTLEGRRLFINLSTEGGDSGSKEDSFNFDSGLIPMIKTFDGKKAVLIAILFTLETARSATSYGNEYANVTSSYRLEWENGTEIISGTVGTNIYVNLLNYDMGTNTGIRLKATGYGSIQIGTHIHCYSMAQAELKDISLVYKVF